MKSAVYPGSFDPVTNGHIDIIRRAAEMYDELTICVMENRAKKSLFTVEERIHMLELVTKDIPNVRVDSYYGLLIDYAKSIGAHISIRGLRAVTDFEYEPPALARGAGHDVHDHEPRVCVPELVGRQGDRLLRRGHLALRSSRHREAGEGKVSGSI